MPVWRKQGEEEKERKEQQENEAQNANQHRPPSESLPADRKDPKRRWAPARAGAKDRSEDSTRVAVAGHRRKFRESLPAPCPCWVAVEFDALDVEDHSAPAAARAMASSLSDAACSLYLQPGKIDDRLFNHLAWAGKPGIERVRPHEHSSS
jgi:hypothetical protein